MISCNILLSDEQGIVSYIPRTRRGHSPSALVIESLNTVAKKKNQAYLYGVQDDLLDVRDRTRLTCRARACVWAMSRKTPTKLQPELTPSRNAVSMVRGSRQNACPTCGLTEAVHCLRSGRVRGRESE